MSRKQYAGVVYVYALADGSYKIGATHDLKNRLRDHLQSACWRLYREGHLFHTIATDATIWAERYLHTVMYKYRLRGEIFALPADALSWLSSLARLDRFNEPTARAFGPLPKVPPPAFTASFMGEPPPKLRKKREPPPPKPKRQKLSKPLIR
jgi:hypothetical protein